MMVGVSDINRVASLDQVLSYFHFKMSKMFLVHFLLIMSKVKTYKFGSRDVVRGLHVGVHFAIRGTIVGDVSWGLKNVARASCEGGVSVECLPDLLDIDGLVVVVEKLDLILSQ